MNRLLVQIMLFSIILAMTTVWAGNETRTEANNDRESQAQEDEGYSYYVYERSICSTEENPVGVVGRWAEEGRHFNLGPRDFTTEQAFIADILESRGR